MGTVDVMRHTLASLVVAVIAASAVIALPLGESRSHDRVETYAYYGVSGPWLVAPLVSMPMAQVAPAVVTTVAGIGPPNIGDGLPATQAALEAPHWTIPAPDGSFLIVDYQNHRIRRVMGDGTIETVAGVGAAEGLPLGDGGPAREASLRFPRNAAFGPDGTLYVADSNHYAIRAIDPTGNIRTVAGNRNPFYGGDGGPATQASFASPAFVAVDAQGILYVADQQAHRVRKITRDGLINTIAGTGAIGTSGDGGPAMAAALNSPSSLAFSAGGRILFISTRDGLRRLDLASGIITTVGAVQGGGAGVCADGENNLYLAEGSRVRRLNLDTLSIQTVAGAGGNGFSGDGGPAVQAQLNGARGACPDARGNLYIADTGNGRVRRVGPDGTVTTVAGGAVAQLMEGNAFDVIVNDSQGLAVDVRGDLFFADFQKNLIRRLDSAGRITIVAGDGRQTSAGDGGHPRSASFSQGLCLIFDHRGNLLFIDLTGGPAIVRSISPGANGVIDGSPDEQIVRIAGQPVGREFADHGAADGKPATQAVFNAARGIALDREGNLYVADAFDHRIRKVVPGADGVLNGGSDEIITTIAGTGRDETSGDGGPADRAGLQTPVAIASDRSNNLFVLQGVGDRRIRRIDGRSGIITTFANAVPGQTVFLLTDPDGNVLWGDNVRFFRASPAGVVERIAGSGERGFGGDGGDPIMAVFRGIMFGALDAGTGELYLADNGNFRIRRISWR